MRGQAQGSGHAGSRQLTSRAGNTADSGTARRRSREILTSWPNPLRRPVEAHGHLD
ncbi:hypothetical protein SAMN05216257_107113 [Meinhardsimonia xiamenensis]|uniref:Uncharacterized protein n=1 Tax=Meinhardsimonia xiamenensis TaxID=990712 RepID=A0A1G9GHY0_9RHOB|nr:hypothetical protein LV81_02540 [Meinhardsimonia xiamenensis]SDL00284.1 hypothetical protein SAMN05216257_107113 [Meinhardsimonia xiamenensis]